MTFRHPLRENNGNSKVKSLSTHNIFSIVRSIDKCHLCNSGAANNDLATVEVQRKLRTLLFKQKDRCEDVSALVSVVFRAELSLSLTKQRNFRGSH